MKPKRKDGYHHGDLRRALLSAALEVVRDAGVGALSLREVARRAGVSSAAPYHHFAHREALLAALCHDGFARFGHEGALALAAAGPSPRARFLALGRSYIRFAREHPAYFRLMFTERYATTPGDAVGATPDDNGYTQLVEAVRALQAVGEAPAGDPTPTVLAAWSMVHGLSTLALDDGNAPRALRGVAVEEVAITAFVDMLAAAARERRREDLAASAG